MRKSNKYTEGQVVHAKANPALKLVIRRCVDNIYYCGVQEYPDRKELVYFEREIEADTTAASSPPDGTQTSSPD